MGDHGARHERHAPHHCCRGGAPRTIERGDRHHSLEIVDRMTTRIGLALARDAVRAVAVRRRRILWAAEAPLEPGAALDAAIRSLLAAAPVPRFPRPVLSAAIGPQASQVRLVAGLPDIQDSETLA